MIEHHITQLTEETFNAHMSAAKCFAESNYSRGYMRGVQRLYHGENFGTPEEHEQWLQLSGDRKELGDGYRDGYAGKMFDFARIT